MDPRVLGAVAHNGGLIARTQLLDLGVGPGSIRTLLRHGTFRLLRRGVYTTTEHWESLDERGQHLLVARAVCATMRRGWVLSHHSAAALHGLPTLAQQPPVVHITRPGWTNAWTENGVCHHLAGFDRSDVVEVDGIEALSPARTAVDVARDAGVQSGLVVCDAALRSGTRRDALVASYQRMKSWPGVRAVRTAVELADGGAETPLESLARHLVYEAGIGTPQTQFPVHLGGRIAWCDLVVGNHVIEADGRVKYRSPTHGGVAEDVERAVWDEKLRERALTEKGLVVTRVVWADLWGDARQRAVRRLAADHAESVRRFGPDLAPHLAAQADEIRRRHGGHRSA